MSVEKTRAALRSVMPIAQRYAYLDHAAVAPLPAPTSEQISQWLKQASDDGILAWAGWARHLEETRRTAAALIGAAADEIALVPSTTAGINLVAEGYPWQSGDNVVTLADEFPSNQYPWMNLASREVETRRVPTQRGRLDLDALRQACNERTRIISISWVGYSSGYRRDLDAVADLAQRKNVLLLVDAIQALGAFPLDVSQTPIDFLAADGHKWQLGPEGAGIAYIRRQNLERIRPTTLGWNSVVQGNDFSKIALDLKPQASRFEGGSQNMCGFLALGASLKLLTELGIPQIAAAILDITDHACEALASFGAEIVSHRDGAHRSGIVAFQLPGADPERVRRHCWKHGVVISQRSGWLRISAHAYNNRDDIDRLIEALRSAPSDGALPSSSDEKT